MASHVYSTSRRGLLGRAMALLPFAAAAGTAVAVSPAKADPTPELVDGLAIINVGGRVVLVDTTDFRPGRGEMVVIGRDGASLTFNRPIPVGFGTSPRSFLSEPARLKNGMMGSHGVHVIGRVIGERP